MYADGGGLHLPFIRTEFFVSKRAVDALGLIICGGLSRDQSVSAAIARHFELRYLRLGCCSLLGSVSILVVSSLPECG